jgi:hypothetical protein
MKEIEGLVVPLTARERERVSAVAGQLGMLEVAVARLAIVLCCCGEPAYLEKLMRDREVV